MNFIPVDPAGHAMRGTANALSLSQGVGEMNRGNALRDFMGGNAGAVASGDATAINALGALDPTMAMRAGQNAQSNQRADQQFAMQQERLGLVREETARQIARETAAMDAAEKAQMVEQVQGLQRGLVVAETPEEFENFRNQSLQMYPDFADELAGMTFENRGSYAAMLDGVKEGLSIGQAPKPADEYGRYAQEETAAGRQPLSRIDYKKAGHKSSRISMDADGNVVVAEGAAADAPPKLTVDAGKNTGFLIRLQDSAKVLDSLEGQGTDFIQQNLENVPFGAGNYFRSEEFQKYDQARRDFVNAILRRESGAVISDSEFENANQQYFPVPGDGPEVIAQKRQNRANAIAGVRAGAGDGAAYVDQMQSEKASNPNNPDFAAMSDEALDAWIAENGE